MEIGYADTTFSMSYEGLDQIFLDDILKLVKEQNDAEDIQNARHREEISEINTRYQEKLSLLRAQQANRRRKFLRRELEARLSQYHEARIDHYSNTGMLDARGYCSPAVAGTAGEAHRGYVSNEFKSYLERPPSVGRVPYPESDVYNSGARYY